MSKKVTLSTNDNPYDPFTQFDQWYRFDVEHQYNSCSYLARIAKTSEQLSEEENDSEIEKAVDEIIKRDFRNIYKKVTQE